MLDLTPPNKRPPNFFDTASQGQKQSHIAIVSPTRFWLTLLPAIGALLITAYLSFVSLILGVPPAGCGEGSGCGQVLASHYAKIMGIPVSVPALVVYALVILLLLQVRNAGRGSALPSTGAWFILMLLAGIILGSVAWFTWLQLFVLGEICFYCMIDHALGTWVAMMVLLLAYRVVRLPTSGSENETNPAAKGASRFVLPLCLGLFFPGVFAFVQSVQPEIVRYIELPTEGDYDLTDSRGRHIGLLNGEVTFTVQDMPYFGSMDAEHVLVLMYDYACPHCRSLHHMAKQMVNDGQLDALLVYMPMAIHPACNPYMEGAQARFDQSCALAHISFTVFLASRDNWQAFDDWMFRPQQPRTVAEARDYVAQHISPALLDDPQWQEPAAAMLRENIEVFGSIPVEHPADRRVPVTLCPHANPIMGPIHQRDTLLQFLQSRGNTSR